MARADESHLKRSGIILLRTTDARILEGPGKRSAQIVSLSNAPEVQITVTHVVLRPGAVSPCHRHEKSEQTWIVERGTARLLTEEGPLVTLVRGDVVITKSGVTHGIENIGDDDFVYLTLTTPPEDMTKFYGAK